MDYERDYLQTGWKRSAPEHRTERRGEYSLGQVRNDAENISGEIPSDTIQLLVDGWEFAQTVAGNRGRSESSFGRDDSRTRKSSWSNRGTESQRPDEVGRTDEQL